MSGKFFMMVVHVFFLFAKDLNIGLGVLAPKKKGNKEATRTSTMVSSKSHGCLADFERKI
jgi:hypothetical protein